MPISTINGSWINFSWSNCVHTIAANGSIVYNTIGLNQLNTSGLVCSITVNFPWFFPLFLLVMGVAILFLFAYLQTARLLVVGMSFIFVLASILWGYGFLDPATWLSCLMALLLAIGYAILVHRG